MTIYVFIGGGNAEFGQKDKQDGEFICFHALKPPAYQTIRPERLRQEWINSAEGVRFSKLMTEIKQPRQTAPPEKITEAVVILSKKTEKNKQKKP
jgi:hypothetical protein